MNSKKLTLLLVPVTAVLALASCGKKTDPVDDKKVDIQFWCSFGQSIQTGVNEMISNFTKAVKAQEGVELNITLDYQGGYDDIYDKISSGLSTGNMPTLAVAYPDHVASYLKSEETSGKKYVVDLNSYINDSKVGFGKEKYLGDSSTDETYGADDIVSTFYTEGQSYAKSGTYSMPFMKSSEALFYNFEAVKRAMAGYNPTIATSDEQIKAYMRTITWDQLVDFSRYILENKATVASNLKSVIFYDSDSNMFISRMYQNKIPYSSLSDGKGKIEFKTGENRTKTEAMVQSIVDLVNEKDAIGSNILTTKTIYGQYGSYLFTSEECVFSIGSTGGAGYNEPKSESFTVEVAKAPAVNNNPLYVSQGPTLTILNNPSLSNEANAKKQLYAWKLLKYLTNPEVNTRLCILDSQGYIPIRESAYKSDAYLDYLSQETIFGKTARIMLTDIAGKYIITPCFPGSSELRDYVGNVFASSLNGKTVSQALDEAINSAEAKFR